MDRNFLDTDFSYTKKQAFKILYRKGFLLSLSSSAMFQSIGTFLLGIYFIIDYFMSKTGLIDPIIFAIICFAICLVVLVVNYVMMNKNAEEYAMVEGRHVTMSEDDVCVSAGDEFVCVEIKHDTEWKIKSGMLIVTDKNKLRAYIPTSFIDEKTIEQLEKSISYKKRMKELKRKK
jgi:hypothetical protein